MATVSSVLWLSTTMISSAHDSESSAAADVGGLVAGDDDGRDARHGRESTGYRSSYCCRVVPVVALVKPAVFTVEMPLVPVRGASCAASKSTTDLL